VATGLRERRKQEARQAISGVAMAMFAAKGFDEVTISPTRPGCRR
jgi:AcrR family transcriptional regulator